MLRTRVRKKRGNGHTSWPIPAHFFGPLGSIYTSLPLLPLEGIVLLLYIRNAKGRRSLHESLAPPRKRLGLGNLEGLGWSLRLHRFQVRNRRNRVRCQGAGRRFGRRRRSNPAFDLARQRFLSPSAKNVWHLCRLGGTLRATLGSRLRLGRSLGLSLLPPCRRWGRLLLRRWLLLRRLYQMGVFLLHSRHISYTYNKISSLALEHSLVQNFKLFEISKIGKKIMKCILLYHSRLPR